MNKFVYAVVCASATSFLLVPSAFAQTRRYTTPAQSTPAPIIKIVTPGEGQTIYGNRIPILFSVENFNLVDYQTTPIPQAGQGHIHVWLDDPNPTRDSARKITADSTTYSDVAYGDHNLKAELVANNHQSLTPSPAVNIKFKTSPISSPSPIATSGFDKNTALVILVIVALVIVAAWWYTKEEDEMPAKSKVESRKSKRTPRKASRRRK